MYRIELTPGEVTVFRTIEELATGVRNGLITPKARIYHNASDKWLPIEFHPHYKRALELNGAHPGDAGGPKPSATASKQNSPKRGSPKPGSSAGAGSKPRGDGFTFLNVPLSPVTPLPKSKPRVADLPYIEDDAPAAPPPATRPSHDQTHSHDAAADQPPAEHPAASGTTLDHVRADASTSASSPAAAAGAATDAPIQRSPGYDLDDEPSLELEQPSSHREAAHHAPAHDSASYPAADHRAAHSAPEYEEPEPGSGVDASAEHEAPVRYSAVEQEPAHDAAAAHRPPFKRVLADETPMYRSPAERSANHEAAAHADFEAHLPPEPVRIEEPRDVPRSRLAVEELFAPPAPRTPPLPPVSASPVLELPHISYPEITPAEPPVAAASSGGSRARRTLHLVGAVLLLAAGGYASTTVFSFGREDGGFNAASSMAERPVVPVRTTAPAPVPAPSTTPAPARVDTRATSTSSASARAASPHTSATKAPSAPAGGTLPGSLAPATEEAPLPPASSGFAPALESRAIVTVPLKPARKPDAMTDSSTVAPVIDMQVTAPELQGAESLVAAPRQKGDSAMKRILRAVSGKKDAP